MKVGATMWGQETWTIVLAGALCAAVAAGIAWFLRKREFEPIKFAANLCLQMIRQRTTITSPEFLEPRTSFAR